MTGQPIRLYGPGAVISVPEGTAIGATGVRLAVDVGSVRVGLAASDPRGQLAFPVQTLRRDLRNFTDLDEIAAQAQEREAVEVLVGLPRSLSGKEGPAAVAAREYATQLAKRLSIPIRMVDERLSTVSAHQSLRAAGVAGRKQRGAVDQAAAVVFLQTSLDALREGKLLGHLLEKVPSKDA